MGRPKIDSRIPVFLNENGWEVSDTEAGSTTYSKEGCVDVQICVESDYFSDEIVLIGDDGDFAHVALDYYALIGVLFAYRQIGTGFNF